LLPFIFTRGKKKFMYPYEIRAKSNRSQLTPVSAADVVYLIMPDRFSNGDVRNDTLPGFYQGTHRDRPHGRHGGDLKGIGDHLNYLQELGITTLWLNPVLENNQKRESYHGYAITDLYRVDARFGTNEDYRLLIERGHAAGIKMIQDMVMNHIGNEHWLVRDLPEKDWIHQFPEFTRSNYRNSVVSDPYRSASDQAKMSDGWFDYTMADVNQRNPFFATYLIQNSLWWIEYAALDGIRMDTYPYPDKDFMARWAKAVTDEYPDFYIVGEVWINSIPTVAYWQKGMMNTDGYQSHLPSVTDFPFFNGVVQALNETAGYETSMARVYSILAQDFLYPNPSHNLTFLDNHDVTRIATALRNDPAKIRMALTLLLTTRGIPQLYYGTELQMDGDAAFHPDIRKTFPGGWKEDKANAFEQTGRTKEQNEMFEFTKRLLNWRKGQTAIHAGKLIQYVPENNVYVYFRIGPGQRVMVIMNGNDKEVKISTNRFKENMGSSAQAMEIISGNTVTDLSSLTVPPNASLILELK